jgi:hypothetical protein
MLKTVSSVANALGALNYKGTWNASTNTPTLASGVGTQGDYYVVSVAGATDLDGITNWGVGDWATFNGSVWQRVEDGNFVDLDVSGTTTLNEVDVGGRLVVSGTSSIDSVWTGASSAGVGGAFRAVQDDGAAMASGDRIGYLVWGGAYDGASSIGYNGAISAYATENWTASARGTEVIIQTTDNGSTGRNNRLTVKNDGTVEISKNLKITTSGNGIDFSATAGTGTSELLDDYEEGAWTPALAGSSTAGSFTYTTQNGVYTKIGNIVIASANVKVASVSTSAAGFARLTGGPFTSNGTATSSSATTATVAFANSYVSAAMRSSGSTEVIFYDVGTAGLTTLDASLIVANSVFRVTTVYYTG